MRSVLMLFVVVQSLSCVWLFVTPWTAHQASLSFTNSQSLLILVSMESVMPSNHLILCCPLLLLPASESFLMSQLCALGGQSIGASASACPSNEYSGLISFRTGWFDLLGVQGTLKSLLQHHSINSFTPSLLYGPINHSCDNKDLCWQSNVSAF